MDNLSREQRSECMSKIRNKNTLPERVVNEVVKEAGFRPRLHDHRLPGKPDIVISSKKLALFINGCFWHQHKGCKRQALPKSNVEYWHKKLRANVARQKKTFRILEEMGWKPVIIWECQTKDRRNLRRKVAKHL